MFKYAVTAFIALCSYIPALQATDPLQKEEQKEETLSETRKSKGLKDGNPKPLKLRRICGGENSFAELCENLEGLCNSNAQAYQEADTEGLDCNYEHFKALTQSPDWSDEVWKKAVKKSKKWIQTPYSNRLLQAPSQTDPRDAVGGHLFYPPDMNRLLASPYTDDLIKRRDHMRGLAIATKYRHPVADYYLTYMLKKMYDAYTESYIDDEKGYPTFFKGRFEHAAPELEQCQDHPDACYVLGRVYCFDAYKVMVYRGDPQKAYDLLMKGGDARNKLEALIVKRQSTMIFPEGASTGDFLALAEQENYGPAYVEAAVMAEEEDKKLDYAQKAVEAGFYPGCIEKGYIFEAKGDKEQALAEFEKAGRNGVPYGYIICAALIADHLTSFPCALEGGQIQKLSSKELEDVVKYFTLAGCGHDPQGWEQLDGLYLNSLSLVTKEEENEVAEKAYAALVEGVKLGSPDAYHTIARGRFSQSLPALIEKYGPSTSDSYYQHIEKFLEEGK